MPEAAFVFCCFNGSYKITPEVFDAWMQPLGGVPQSVLWLLDDYEVATRNLRARSVRHGIDPSRLVFAPRVALQRHLPRYRVADLFLDTLPCNAHTTASDVLWAGLPVLTCEGAIFAGRVAASRESSPLFNAGRLCLGLEAAYVLMWQRAENHLPPIHFAVPDHSIGRVSQARYV